VDKSNPKYIYVEGLHPHLQSDVRLQITSEMTQEEVMHVAQTMVGSKRHALSLLPLALANVRTPTGVKPLLRNFVAAQYVKETELESAESAEFKHLSSSKRSCRWPWTLCTVRTTMIKVELVRGHPAHPRLVLRHPLLVAGPVQAHR
jgi:hypothetical protein